MPVKLIGDDAFGLLICDSSFNMTSEISAQRSCYQNIAIFPLDFLFIFFDRSFPLFLYFSAS